MWSYAISKHGVIQFAFFKAPSSSQNLRLCNGFILLVNALDLRKALCYLIKSIEKNNIEKKLCFFGKNIIFINRKKSIRCYKHKCYKAKIISDYFVINKQKKTTNLRSIKDVKKEQKRMFTVFFSFYLPLFCHFLSIKNSKLFYISYFVCL